jgi:hypothetical protein
MYVLSKKPFSRDGLFEFPPKLCNVKQTRKNILIYSAVRETSAAAKGMI